MKIEVRNTLGSALYCVDNSSRKLTQEDIKAIEAAMKQLVSARTPIELKLMSKAEAMKVAGSFCVGDREALLKQVPEDKVLSLYFLCGEPGYFFGPMCPDCGYVPNFELLPYGNGVIINYPDVGDWTHLPPFEDKPKLNAAYQEAEDWSAMIQCNTIGKLNKLIEGGYAGRIIQVAEALHEKKLASLLKIPSTTGEAKLPCRERATSSRVLPSSTCRSCPLGSFQANILLLHSLHSCVHLSSHTGDFLQRYCANGNTHACSQRYGEDIILMKLIANSIRILSRNAQEEASHIGQHGQTTFLSHQSLPQNGCGKGNYPYA